MPNDRFFVANTLQEHAVIELVGDELHHLTNVMRKKVGDLVEVVNGKGALATALIEKNDKRSALLHIENCYQSNPPKTPLILAQALPKIKLLDLIVEKGTELGVDEFWLFPGKLSEKKELSPNQLQRLKQITISALKQCGRLFLPHIQIMTRLEDIFVNEGALFFGDWQSTTSLISILPQVSSLQKIVACIGPEKGFCREEVLLLQQKGQGIKLNNNILRCETAAIACISLLRSS